jgi:hypothetical protein
LIEIYLAGEGRTELGGWSNERMYRDSSPDPGVIETLLKKTRTDGWRIRDATQWRHIVKLRPGKFRAPETRNVLGAALHASEQDCAVLAFSRDRDGDLAREDAIAEGIAQAQHEFPEVRVVGGLAIEQIESWVLAAGGRTRTESITDAKAAAEQAFGGARLETLLRELEKADIAKLPADAVSLRAWLARAEAVLPK